MNTYNIEEKGCVFFHAIAENERQVINLATEAGFDITGMDIELERTNVRNELGQPYQAQIREARV